MSERVGTNVHFRDTVHTCLVWRDMWRVVYPTYSIGKNEGRQN